MLADFGDGTSPLIERRYSTTCRAEARRYKVARASRPWFTREPTGAPPVIDRRYSVRQPVMRTEATL